MKMMEVPTDLGVEDIRKIVEPLRKMGKTLVTTNGCFDLLHTGHVKYLHDASRLGDILVVGINSDRSVSRLKGPSRPIRNERDRILLIGSLKTVDYAFVFNEPDPCAFLGVLQPDIHVKGGDYSPADLPETAVVERYGGRVVIVPFTEGYSTTRLIAAIQTK
ncbi:MAG: D-glycero-beta-D-manno-heptose 1-phosphate adenylyltransferase [Chitinispirillaceae bacterium]|nr:D-glycero-beta-D-manno-heptose 1-phosphate adenylyltransferase [Chitinispirillaceae bacterium]